MLDDAEEMRLRDEVIGLRAELVDANYQRQKAVSEDAALRNKLSAAEEQLRAATQAQNEASRSIYDLQNWLTATKKELTAVRQSRTWRVGRFILAPTRWVKRESR